MLIQNTPNDPGAIVRSVVSVLAETYGKPGHGNPPNPLDDLIYIIVSNRTGYSVANRVYYDLKSTYIDWSDLLAVTEREVSRCLRPAGFGIKRATQICGIIRRLRDDFGIVSLEGLRHMATSQAESYLCSLPGVSLKVAKCVLMYTCRRRVLPVDVHVHRITGRLGWHQYKRADQCHSVLERLVPPGMRKSFHVTAVAHGRKICRSRIPSCGLCVLVRYCPWGQARLAD